MTVTVCCVCVLYRAAPMLRADRRTFGLGVSNARWLVPAISCCVHAVCMHACPDHVMHARTTSCRYGPHVRVPLTEFVLRARKAGAGGVRQYPDITHTLSDQFPLRVFPTWA